MKQTELKSNPDKTAAFHRRAQDKARARASARQPVPGQPFSSLAPVSKRKLEAQPEGEPRQRSTLKQTSKGLTASTAQREKVRDLFSIVSGQGPCDPAHLWPQGRGGCSHPDCVVPLTRPEHIAFDAGELDILPALINHECWVELAHMVSEHHVDPSAMLHRLTGERYESETQIVIHARRMAREIAAEAGA